MAPAGAFGLGCLGSRTPAGGGQPPPEPPELRPPTRPMAHLPGAVSAINTGFAITARAKPCIPAERDRTGRPRSRRRKYLLTGSPTSTMTGANAISTSVTAQKMSARAATRPRPIRSRLTIPLCAQYQPCELRCVTLSANPNCGPERDHQSQSHISRCRTAGPAVAASSPSRASVTATWSRSASSRELALRAAPCTGCGTAGMVDHDRATHGHRPQRRVLRRSARHLGGRRG
jgi:hypothetical protein